MRELAPFLMNTERSYILNAPIRSYLSGRKTLQKVVANFSWLFVEKILRMAVGLAVAAYVARYLGAEQFGKYNYSLAFVSLFTVFATLGLDQVIVRAIVRNPDDKDAILGTAFGLRLIAGALALLGAHYSVLVLRPDDESIYWLVSIIAIGLVFRSLDVVDLWFQSQIQSVWSVLAKNISFLLGSSITIILIVIQAPLVFFGWVTLLEIIMGVTGLIFFYYHKGQKLAAWRINLQYAKDFVRVCGPLIFSGLAIYFQARIDQVMLGSMKGDWEVGQYSSAMRLIETAAFLPMIIISSVAPLVAREKLKGESAYWNILINLYRIMFICFVVVFIPIYLFADRAVILVFGSEYRYAGELLSLFAVRLFFAHYGIARSLFITNNGLFNYSLVVAIIGALLNVVLNYLLIPKYASVGALWATIISFFVTVFLIDIIFSKTRENARLMLKSMITPWRVSL